MKVSYIKRKEKKIHVKKGYVVQTECSLQIKSLAEDRVRDMWYIIIIGEQEQEMPY